MMLWIAIGAMCLLATMFVAWPLYKNQKRLSGIIAGTVGGIVVLALGLYAYQGSPEIPSGAGVSGQPDIEQMVASLAERLEGNPDDLDGWKMLGRSHMTMQNFDAAVIAFERAVALEDSQNGQTLVDLGGAILARDNTPIEGRTSALFESALALEPNNPAALFYAGIAALNRGNTELAADRWEVLLGLNPPEEIRGIVEQRVAEWRGEPLPVPRPQASENLDFKIVADVSLADAASESLPVEASVFVIARDPAQPSPPIAVTRRVLSELPATIELSDGDSMIPGRILSAFQDVEIVARVSVSGQPIAQSGDWFGAVVVKPAENNRVSLLIDQQEP
ncbi:MAG: tetratricopeptide repeat protein [Woeseiaceae bacterium]